MDIEDIETYERQSTKLLENFLETEDVTQDIVDSYDDWVHRLGSQMNSMPPSYIDENGKKVSIYVKNCVGSVQFTSPTYCSGKKDPLAVTPWYALNRLFHTYESEVKVLFEFIGEDGVSIATADKYVSVFSIPIMVGSKLCMTSGKKKEILEEIGINPYAKQGYFIISDNGNTASNKYFMPYKDKMRSDQIRIQANKKGPYSCILNNSTFTDSVKMEIFIHENEEFVYRSNYLGDLPNNEKINGITSTIVNVLHLADILNYYSGHKYSKKNELVSTRFSEDVYNFCESAGVSKTQAFLKFESTLILFRTRSTLSVWNNILNNLGFQNKSKRERSIETSKIFRSYIFPYAKTKTKKILMMAYMCARLILSKATNSPNGNQEPSKKSSMSSKSLNSAGSFFSKSFRYGWGKASKKFEEKQEHFRLNSRENILNIFAKESKKIVKGAFKDLFHEKMRGDNKKNNDSIVEAEYFEPTNIISWLSSLTKIKSGVSSRTGIKGRALDTSAQGFICAAETPDNKSCGIINHKSITARITPEPGPGVMLNLIHCLKNRFSLEREKKRNTPLFINGIIYGWCDGETLRNSLVSFRRSRNINKYICICMNVKLNIFDIYTNKDRPVIPMLVIKDGKILAYEDRVMNTSINFLLEKGYMEYLDAYEIAFLNIAESYQTLLTKTQEIENLEAKIEKINLEGTNMKNLPKLRQDLKTISQEHHYIALNELTIYGVSASTIPLASHNQAGRIINESKYNKQALTSSLIPFSIGASIQILHPTHSNISTATTKVFGCKNYAAGAQLILAVASYEANQEDSLIISERALDKFKYKIVHKFNLSDRSNSEKFGIFDEEDPKYRHLTKNGLPRINSFIKEGEIIIGKILTKTTELLDEKRIDKSLYMPKGKKGVVRFSKFLSATHSVYVIIEEEKLPQVGDKLSIRTSQKAIIGEVMRYVDMPVIGGIVPDLILNPLSLPSRMTVGTVLEMFIGNYSTTLGKQYNLNKYRNKSFTRANFRKAAEFLPNNFSHDGYHTAFNGITGEPIEGDIYSGIMYVKQLHHLAEIKGQSIGTGIRDLDTGQLLKGAGNVRTGEQTFAVFDAHNLRYYKIERSKIYSNQRTVTICKSCGLTETDIVPSSDPNTLKDQECYICQESNMGKVTTTHAFLKMSYILASLGIKISLKSYEPEEHLEELSQKYENVSSRRII